MKYYIITFGCQMNKSDSERIATILEKNGYEPVKADSSAEALAKADLIVVNMCSVRQSAVDRVYGLFPKFKKLKEKNPKLKTVLTGCVLKEDRKKLSKTFDLILNIKELPNWSKILNKKTAVHFGLWPKLDEGCDYLKIGPKYQNEFLALIPISNGCNFNCTYCVVPFVRGRLICRDHQEILAEIERVIKNGVKEIWLLGQNVDDYRSPTDSSINFSKLLRTIDEIEGNFKILFTSPHPKNFSDELIETLASLKKFGKYLNLPVQSGDDEILKKMKRNYIVNEYKELVKKIREKIPDINLSTDIIVGFPSETQSQFENTVKLMKEIRFNLAYISKYSPRPGTAAFQLKDNVPWEEKKKREKILREIFEK